MNEEFEVGMKELMFEMDIMVESDKIIDKKISIL